MSLAIRILCHNVFWFQGYPFEPDTPGDPLPVILKALATIYKQILPDVFCLQEIQSHSTFEAVCKAFDMKGYYSPGHDLSQYGGCILCNRPGTVKSSETSSFSTNRFWQILSYPSENGKDLRIANVHLPSDRHLGAMGGLRQRLRELEHIVALKPQVVCGDFNERPHGAVSEFMNKHMYTDSAVKTQNEDVCSAISGRRGDYIWVHETMADRIKAYDCIAPSKFTTDVKGKTFISDHLPIWIDLEAP